MTFKKNRKKAIGLSARYFVLIVLGLFNLYLFYKTFTPLTVYPVFLILKALFGAELITGTKIYTQGIVIELVKACIAGAAYYFLTILNMTTPMSNSKRIKSLVFLFSSFLVLNIVRIIIFTVLYSNGFRYFDILHKSVWYFGSTILLLIVWFVNVRIFHISNIPVYTDFKNLIDYIKNK